MEEKFLYSSLNPLFAQEDQKTIDNCFREQIKNSDHLEISVGFSSFASLRELDRLITECGVKKICLILGMYFFNGFPKLLHELAFELNNKWKERGIGEIRLIHSFKYHGKLYCFLKNDAPFSAILGSANLSFLTAESTHLNQYEIALLTTNKEILDTSVQHVNDLKDEKISKNLSAFKELGLVNDKNHLVENQKGVVKIHDHVVERLNHLKGTDTVQLIFKNFSYFERANNKKLKNFFELRISDNNEIKLPKSKNWFFLVTDDGYEFKASFAGRGGKKKIMTFENEELLERWIKGKLLNLGLIYSNNERREEFDEFLESHLLLKNTKEFKVDQDGKKRTVWFLSLPRKSY